MARNTQGGGAVAHVAADQPDRVGQRCGKIELKVRKLERQVWKLHRDVRGEAADLESAARLELKREIERLSTRIRERIERELADIADSL